jgi:hypothetical protein
MGTVLLLFLYIAPQADLSSLWQGNRRDLSDAVAVAFLSEEKAFSHP